MSIRFCLARVAATLLVTFAVSSTLFAADRPDAPLVREEIVAKINGDIVTRGDLEKSQVLLEKELKEQNVTGPAMKQQLDQASKDRLRNKIDEFLMVQKGKELDINVDSDLKREITTLQSESKLSDPDKFHEWIHEGTGMSFEDFQLSKKNELIVERVVSEQVWRNIVIPEADMQKYYDAHKADFMRKESVTLREILISTGDGKPATVAAAQKKAQALLERARSGVDKFTDLARQNSDNQATAAEDGMLGTFERGQLSKSIEDVVFKHEKGYVTDLIRVGAGFEILRVEDHTPEGQASFDDVKGQVNNILTRPIADPKLRIYLTGLRQNAFLQVKDGYIDTGAAPGKDTTWKDPSQLMPQTTTKAAVANQRHMKKLLGVIPYGYAGEKDTGAAAPPAVTPVQQAPPTTNSDGTPRE